MEEISRYSRRKVFREAISGLHNDKIQLINNELALVSQEYKDKYSFLKWITIFIKYDLERYNDRLKIIVESKSGKNRDKYIALYGENEGTRLWNDYTSKQATSNTFEYKQQVHGWTKEQFNNYNNSRAQTEANMIKRYGESEGKEKWRKYCKNQSYAGSSEEYFISKLGYKEGKEKWKEICTSKSHTLDNYIKRYGESEGKEKFNTYINRVSSGYSKISQEFITQVDSLINGEYEGVKTYFATKNGEFGVYNNNIKSYYKIDYVVLYKDEKIALEFNGDHWHCNPEIYERNDLTVTRGAKNKLEFLESSNFKTIVIWEKDYMNNSDKIIKQTLNIIREMLKE